MSVVLNLCSTPTCGRASFASYRGELLCEDCADWRKLVSHAVKLPGAVERCEREMQSQLKPAQTSLFHQPASGAGGWSSKRVNNRGLTKFDIHHLRALLHVTTEGLSMPDLLKNMSGEWTVNANGVIRFADLCNRGLVVVSLYDKRRPVERSNVRVNHYRFDPAEAEKLREVSSAS